MKTKVMNKKGKKRSLSETSVSIKPNKKQGNVNEIKKNPKKAKLADFKQNENSTSGEKTLISKVVNKQKKQLKQQSSIVKPSETKRDTKEKVKLTIVKPKEKTSKTSSPSRKRIPYNTLNLTAEQITKKMEEIRSREVLSKRAKKILSILNRKLKACANDSKKLDTVGKKSNQKAEHRANALIKNKRKVNNEDETKKKPVQIKKAKPQEEEEDEDDSDIEEDKDNDVEEESDEDESDESDAENKLIINQKEEIDDESDEDEEDEEEVEDEEETEDEEDEEDEEDKKNIIKKVKTVEVKKKKIQNKNKQVTRSLDNQKEEILKKKRYILCVDNLPSNITEDEIKQHFLTKVDTITHIRIPRADKTPYNYATVEVANNIDFEKGLSLNHTILKNRKITVEPSNLTENPEPGWVRNIILSELQALRKTRNLADGKQKKKSFKKGK